jgi:prolipoprotein diacylglyceryltransferase
MFLILWVEQQFAKKLKSGDLFLIYLIGYAIGRFLLEFLRLDTAQAFGFDFNQYFMAAVAVVAGGWLFVRLTNVDEDSEIADAQVADVEPESEMEETAAVVENDEENTDGEQQETPPQA